MLDISPENGINTNRNIIFMKKPGTFQKLLNISAAILIFFTVNISVFGFPDKGSGKVIIATFEQEIPDPQTEDLVSNMSHALQFLITTLNDFSVTSVLSIPGNTSPEKLKGIAEDFQIDFGIILSAEKSENGDYSLYLGVYNGSYGEELFSITEKTPDFIQALEGTEKIVKDGIEKICSPAPQWGEILLDPMSGRGNFTVFINNTLLAEKTKRLSLIPAGLWTVRIIQERPFGPAVLLDEAVTVRPNETARLSFSVPEITSGEKKAFTALEQSIAEAWFKKDKFRVEQILALASALLQGNESSQELINLQEKYKDWENHYLEDSMPEEIEGYLRESGKLPPVREAEIIPKSREPSSGSRFVQGALLVSGAALTSAGTLFQSFAENNLLSAKEQYKEYLAAGENFDLLYKYYTDRYKKYELNTYIGYSGWGAGFSLLSAGVFFFPGDSLRLSAFGKASACLGVVCGLGGNLLYSMAGIQGIKNQELWEQYYTAAENLNPLYIEYTNGHWIRQTEKIYGWSLWGGSVLLSGLSFILPGEKKPVLSTPGQKILFALGTILSTGSSFTSGLSFDYFIQAQEAYDLYANAAANFDDLYAGYTDAMKKYTLTSLITYGLQAAGGIACITAILLPAKTSNPGKIEEKPVELSCAPIPGGFSMTISGKSK